MKTNSLAHLAVFAAILLLSMTMGTQLFAQATNCTNIGFKNNSFQNWTGKTGTYSGTAPNPFVLSREWTATQLSGVTSTTSCRSNDPSPNRFVINSDTNAYDKNVVINGNNKILRKIPQGYTHSARLGNACVGAEAEALYYRFQVTEATALLTIMYAMVLEAPHPGAGSANPTFDIKIREESPEGSGIYPDNTEHSPTQCTEYDVIADPAKIDKSDTTFVTFSGGSMLYRKWKPLVMNLSTLTGQNLEMTISMGDCSYSGHYGYMYLTGECDKLKMETGVFMQSNSDTTAIATAPFGLTYKWVQADENPDDPNTKIYSTQQNVYLTDDDFDGKQGIKLKCYMNMLVPNGGCGSQAGVEIQNKKPWIIIKDSIQCNGVVSFDSTSSGAWFLPLDETTHRWDFGDESPISSEAKPTHQYAKPNIYTVSYSVSTIVDPSTGYAYTTTKRKKIEILPDPKARIGGASGVCPGYELTLLSDSNNTSDTLIWGSRGQEVKDTVLTQKYDNTETVYLIARNPYCSDTAYKTIRIKTPPIIEIIGDSLTCMGNTITLTASSDNGVVYNWKHGKKGAIITEKPQQSITYTVLASNDIGCTSEKSVRVQLIVPTLSASISKICPGDSVVLTASDAYAYEWSSTPNDASLVYSDASLTKAIAVPAQTTTYRMVGSGQNGCKADALSVRVEVYPYPIPTIENTPSTIDSDNPAILFNDRSPYGVTSYWEFGDGISSDRRSITHVYQDLSKDTITVYLKSTNAIGCWRDTTKPLLVSLFSIWAPTAFTPDQGGPNQSFKFYSKNELSSFQLVIMNRWGQKIFETNNINIPWDGTSNGKVLPADSYVWLMTYKRKDAERVYERKGHVNLIR